MYKCSIWAGHIAKNNKAGSVTYSSVLAAWNADQKGAGSNLLNVLLFFFISNLKDVGLNPEN